jgi:hypothetical protein
MKNDALTIALTAMVATLTACGGGGGGASSDVPPTQTDFTSKYVGTWSTGCYATTLIQDVNANANANTKEVIRLERIDNTRLNLATAILVYAASDKTCTSPVIGSIQNLGTTVTSPVPGLNGFKSSVGANDITVKGTATAEGKTVEQVVISKVNIFSGISANNFSFGSSTNPLSLNPANFLAKTTNNISYLNANMITVGVADATTFPAALSNAVSNIYIKDASVAAAISASETASNP